MDDLSYSEAVAVVTDTEATMIDAGRLFASRSLAHGGKTKWLGCIDHLLQLVTKKIILWFASVRRDTQGM